mmetsp:Transcript_10403/g.23790  ORF Transcript_10403/g.23790 Transcript_10403/m.23790 type:complete len:215 (+) Transcript_10403:576-1220(+)
MNLMDTGSHTLQPFKVQRNSLIFSVDLKRRQHVDFLLMSCSAGSKLFNERLGSFVKARARHKVDISHDDEISLCFVDRNIPQRVDRIEPLRSSDNVEIDTIEKIFNVFHVFADIWTVQGRRDWPCPPIQHLLEHWDSVCCQLSYPSHVNIALRSVLLFFCLTCIHKTLKTMHLNCKIHFLYLERLFVCIGWRDVQPCILNSIQQLELWDVLLLR